MLRSTLIDDFAIAPIGARERPHLLELLDDRVGVRSTLLTGQLPIANWHDYIGDATLADAILDRLVHSPYIAENLVPKASPQNSLLRSSSR